MPHQHYHKWKGKAILKRNKQMIPFCLFANIMGFMNILLCLCLRAVFPTCIGHCHLLFWSETGKQSGNHCGAWWGLSVENRPELYYHVKNLQETEILLLFFVYTVHLPIKMQMSACLQLRLGTQIKKGEKKKERNKWKDKFLKSSGHFLGGEGHCV